MRLHKNIGLGLVLVGFSIAQAAFVLAANGWTGYLVDRMCSSTQKNTPSALSFAKAHTRECALQAACKGSGFEIFTGGHWLNLDAKGNELAKQYLEKSKQQNAIQVHVEGSLKGDTISVTKLVGTD